MPDVPVSDHADLDLAAIAARCAELRRLEAVQKQLHGKLAKLRGERDYWQGQAAGATEWMREAEANTVALRTLIRAYCHGQATYSALRAAGAEAACTD